MITWAYSLDSDKSLIKDFAVAQSSDTIATQTNGTAGAYVAAKGDIVSLNDQGRACKAKFAVPTGKTNPYIEAAAVLGVCEGGNFLGLAQGGTWAATAANQNDVTGPLAKVHVSTTDVYRVDLISGGTMPAIGTAVSLSIDPNMGIVADPTNPTGATTIFKVTDVNTNTNRVFGVFTALEFVS